MIHSGILNNVGRLRAWSKEADLDALERLLRNMLVIVEERREEAARIRREQSERRGRQETFCTRLLEEGIDPAKLIENLQLLSAGGKRLLRHARYHYTDAYGNEQTWTGQGRTPNIIRAAIDNGGKTLADFEI